MIDAPRYEAQHCVAAALCCRVWQVPNSEQWLLVALLALRLTPVAHSPVSATKNLAPLACAKA